MAKEKIIVIGGPTASGKSDFAIDLAKYLDTEIISADSMQIYKHMNIGTAKVSADEMKGVKHYMLDIAEPTEAFSVSNYVDIARQLIKDINSKGKIPIIVGGTGLYIDALIYDFEFNNANIDMEYRQYLQNLAKEKGNLFVHNMLKQIDNDTAEKIHPNNVKRVIRALEICKANNGKKSENKKTLRYDLLMYVIDTERSVLYDRINARVDRMIDQGLENEIKNLLANGLTFDLQSMQAIGYKEWREYFNDNIDINSVKNAIKQNSRNYAKRQITWFFNKYKDLAHFVSFEDKNLAIHLADKFKNNLL